jgi:hypothetical protein
VRRLLVILGCTLAIGGVTAAIAWAVSVRDRDDVTTGLDIAKTAGSHNRASDQLVHAIDFYEAVSPKSMLNKDKPPSSICVEIWTRSKPAESPADYEACISPTAKGKGWAGSVARKRDIGPRLRLGPVKVEQPTATRLVMRIDPDDIKRPSSYRWRTESNSFGSDCKSSTGCPDYTPDRPDTAETRLSKPRT